MKTEKEKEKPVKKTTEKKEIPAAAKADTKDEKVVDEELQAAKRRIGPLAERVEKFAVDKMTLEQVRSLLDQVAALKVPEVSEKATWKKDDTLEKLQIRAGNALKKLQGPAVIKALASLDPSKLSPSCLGVLIDRRNPDCAECPTQKECMVEFLKNTQDLFLKHKGARFAAAKANEEAESKDAAQKVAADEQRTKQVKAVVKAAKEKAGEDKAKEPAATPVKTQPVYDPERKIKCLASAPKMGPDTPRSFKKMVLRIVKEQPTNMRELHKIISSYYEMDAKNKTFVSLYISLSTSENPKERIIKAL